MKLFLKNLLVLSCFLSTTSYAQFQGNVYVRNNSTKVFVGTQQQALAWCGGFNNPQFALGDLNHDGKKDLVIYERYTKQVKTFINIGVAGNTQYTYEPKYALNFPEVDEYLKLEDYNDDGIPDLFHRGAFDGLQVYKGYYNSNNELCFTFYKSVYYNNDSWTTGDVNVYVDPSDIPAIADVDNDGDIDFIAYWAGGAKMFFYQNQQVELGMPPDSIYMKLKDRCWGKVEQTTYRTHILDFSCDNSGLNKEEPSGQQRHTGNNICLFDFDGDGDYDYLDGNISYSDVQFLKNNKAQKGNGRDSMVAQDSLWKGINLPQWPAPFWLDIDQDGDNDLLFSPHLEGTSENYKTIVYFKNTGSAANPVYTAVSDTFLVDQTIDVGTASAPYFYDYDKDGKPDLLIGSDGYFQSNGTFKSRISYYKNTSTTGNPAFTLQTKDLAGLSGYGIGGAAISIGDLDNDGKDDLIIGKSDGTLLFIKNTAASATVQPVWTSAPITLVQSTGANIDAGNNAAPCIYDIDKDGKPDLLIGNLQGYIQYYKNVSPAAGTLKLEFETNKIGNVKADPNNSGPGYCMPFVGKMDNTGIDYLLTGNGSGAINRFDGFQNGNTSITYPLIDEHYANINEGSRTAPAVADIDGDGKYEMVIGNLFGGLTFFKQDLIVTVGVHNIKAGDMHVRIYPNPASNMIYLSWEKDIADENIEITLFAAAGNMVTHKIVPAGSVSAQLEAASLPSGIYYCQLVSGNKKLVLPVTVLK